MTYFDDMRSELIHVIDDLYGCTRNLAALPIDAFCDAVLDCSGYLVLTGVGKAGHVGRKLSSTFASLGVRSFFLDATDALHGDLGRVSRADLVLILSNSGETQELIRLVPHLRKIGVAKICLLCSTRNSALGDISDITIQYGKVVEAGFGLAPTTSTTIMMAIGDALALTIQNVRGFGNEDFARLHPGGALAGKAVRVQDIMRPRDHCAIVEEPTDMEIISKAMTEKHIGICVLEQHGKLTGIVTDGDIRRWFVSKNGHAKFITREPRQIGISALVGAAMAVMRDSRVNALPVVSDNSVAGVIDIQDVVGLGLEI